ADGVVHVALHRAGRRLHLVLGLVQVLLDVRHDRPPYRERWGSLQGRSVIKIRGERRGRPPRPRALKVASGMPTRPGFGATLRSAMPAQAGRFLRAKFRSPDQLALAKSDQAEKRIAGYREMILTSRT